MGLGTWGLELGIWHFAVISPMRVLTVNSHQPYVYDMARISGIELLIIDRLLGRRSRL